MNRDKAITYINQLLIDEYNLMQDRKFDTSETCLTDKEATESELEEIVNAQRFMDLQTEEGI